METDILIPEIKEKETTNFLKKVQNDFLGLETNYQVASGELTRRIYLDSTASTLMMGIAQRTGEKFLQHYSNTHSLMHFSAKIATKTYSGYMRKYCNLFRQILNIILVFSQGVVLLPA